MGRRSISCGIATVSRRTERGWRADWKAGGEKAETKRERNKNSVAKRIARPKKDKGERGGRSFVEERKKSECRGCRADLDGGEKESLKGANRSPAGKLMMMIIIRIIVWMDAGFASDFLLIFTLFFAS
jgi:hypothetical protein